MSIVVRTKIKELALAEGKQLNIAGDFAEKLDAEVDAIIKRACARAVANGRSTVMAKDL